MVGLIPFNSQLDFGTYFQPHMSTTEEVQVWVGPIQVIPSQGCPHGQTLRPMFNIHKPTDSFFSAPYLHLGVLEMDGMSTHFTYKLGP